MRQEEIVKHLIYHYQNKIPVKAKLKDAYCSFGWVNNSRNNTMLNYLDWTVFDIQFFNPDLEFINEEGEASDQINLVPKNKSGLVYSYSFTDFDWKFDLVKKKSPLPGWF